MSGKQKVFKYIKCKICRKSIIEEPELCEPELFVNIHGQPYQDTNTTCNDDSLLFISDAITPHFILTQIQQLEWTKGKISCEHCGARLGHFNFINFVKCPCDFTNIPCIRLIKSKLDLVKSDDVVINK